MLARWSSIFPPRQATVVGVIDRTSGAMVGSAVRVADTAIARMVGLLGVCGLAPGGGLLLAPCSSVHTWGMSFAIDVVALDRQWRVCRLWETLAPGRFSGMSWRTHAMLELPAGAIRHVGIAVGDQLEVVESG